MRNDIQTLRTSKAYSASVRKSPGHPGQDFESLLRERTESYRAEKTRPDSRESRTVKTDSEDKSGQDIRKDLQEGTKSLEEKTARRSRSLTDKGQEDTEIERDNSTSAYLIHDDSRQHASTSASLTLDSGQAAEDLLTAGGYPEAVPVIEAGLADPAQRMKDDVVKAIPTLSENNLQRMENPTEAVKVQPEQEGTDHAGTTKPDMTEAFQKSIQEAGLKAGSPKEDSVKKAALKPESRSGIAEGVKGMEKAGSVSQDPLGSMKMTEKIRNLILKEEMKKEPGHETSEKDPGMEALKGLSSAVKTGEARPVQEALKPTGQMAADKNIEMAATEIVHSVETLKDGDRTTIRVRLYPEEIGEMEITLSMEEGKLSGKILVENKEMRQVFTERLSELSQTLKACHIDVAKFEVGIGAGQQQDQARQQNQRQAAYPARSMGYGNEPSGMEERKLPGKTTARGIDLLA